MATIAPLLGETYESFSGSQITNDMVTEAAALFSAHYGIWSTGKRVRMSATKLRAELLPSGHEAQCTYVRALLNGVYIGHAFACEWLSAGRPILWITQLVVHSGHRGWEIAKKMLKSLERPHIFGYGIASSHAHAIMAAATAFGRGQVEGVLKYHARKFMKEHTTKVMKRSPIRYIREAELHGTLFGDSGDTVGTIDTKFLVDHTEPEEALRVIKEYKREWSLGSLPEGHEFLIFIKPRSGRGSYME